MKFTLSLCMAVTFPLLAVEPVMSENFNTTEKMPPAVQGMNKHASLQPEKIGSGARLLEMKPGASVQFKRVPVQQGVKYRLTFNARSAGPDSLEENPQLAEAFYDANRSVKGLVLPKWNLTFFNSEGKRCDRSILFPYFHVILSSAEQVCSEVFYPPLNAAFVQLSLQNLSPDNIAYIDDVRIAPFTESAVNINPDFKLGKYDHSGYSQAGYGIDICMEKHPSGNGQCLAVNTWCSIDPFPVTGGKNYVLDARLVPDPKQGARIVVAFSDRNGKAIPNCGGTLLVKKTEGGGKTNFIAPPDAASVRYLIHGGRNVKFEYIRFYPQDIAIEK